MKEFWDEMYALPVEKIPWAKTQADWFTHLIDTKQLIGKTALDIGCGLGEKTFYLLEHAGFEYVCGVDISSQAINYATRCAQENNLKQICDFYCFDMSNTIEPIQDKQYDVIVDWATLHCIDEKNRDIYMTHVNCLLETNGLYLLRVFSTNDERTSFVESLNNSSSVISIFSREDILKLFSNFTLLDEHMSQPRTKDSLCFREFLFRKEY